MCRKDTFKGSRENCSGYSKREGDAELHLFKLFRVQLRHVSGLPGHCHPKSFERQDDQGNT
jgi:hypothetical protein